MAMKITFHGGVGGVTGSRHLLEVGQSRILLDCGIFQGHRQEARKLNSQLPFSAQSITAVVLSHGHLDHCGSLPLLIRQGYEGRIYSTDATKDVAEWILKDAAHIQQMDADYMNRHRIPGTELAEPIFTQDDVAEVLARFIEVPYVRLSQEWFRLTPNVRLKLYDAGHILGSAVIVLEASEGERLTRAAYTGDLGRTGTPLLPDPEYIKDEVDILLMESTYGNRTHQPIPEAITKLIEIVNRVYRRGGKIIVPTFSLGRTQELVYVLHQLTDQGKIPRLPIYVDSPLATNLTDVFTRHPETYDEEAWQDFGKKGDLPLAFRNLTYTVSREESKALNTDKRPMIIIAGSGMCESGRVLHHLQNNIEDSRNMILVVGYMAQDTLGRRIVEKTPFVKIFGVEYELNAEVVVINAFSGHADQAELLDFVSGCLPLKRIFLVHGELEQSRILSDLLTQKGLDVYIPDKDEEVLLN